MRLHPDQIGAILEVIHQVAGQTAQAWLFGSRLDDARRGGDVDLLVQSTPPINLVQRARIKSRLEQQIGLPVDVTACGEDSTTHSPFAKIAMTHGVLL